MGQRDATIESLKSSLLTLQRDLLSVHSSIQSDTQRHAEEIRKIKRISEHDTSQLEDQLRKEREEKELERANLSSQIERLKGDLDAQRYVLIEPIYLYETSYFKHIHNSLIQSLSFKRHQTPSILERINTVPTHCNANFDARGQGKNHSATPQRIRIS